MGFAPDAAADNLLIRVWVTINGKVPENGTKITDIDEVRVDGEAYLRTPRKKPGFYIWLFKQTLGNCGCTTEIPG